MRYIIDMAEIPTFQEIQATGLVARTDDPSANLYVAHKAESLRAGLALEVNGQPVALRTGSQEIIFPEGAGGLPTGTAGKVVCLLSGGIDSPVAAHRMMKRGCSVTFVHFHSYPILSRASQEKARELVRLLTT